MQDKLSLSGFRVLDLGERASTAWCARLLADFGAEVVGIGDEHPLRRQGPFDAAGASIPARYFLAAHRWSEPGDLPRLIGDADVIITSAVSGKLAAPALLAQQPQARVCAITPYGIEGAFSTAPGNDLTAYAASGWAWVNGLAGRPPLKGSGYQASLQAGTFAFAAILAALIEQGEGQVIDVAERDVLVSTAAPAPLRYQYSGFRWARRSAVDVNEGPVPVKDGWFALTLSRPAFWIKAMTLLGLPDLAEDKDLQQAGIRPKYKERFVERVQVAMSDWNRMDLFHALGERRVIAGPVLRMDELAHNPQFEAREFIRTAADGTRWPGPFARMSVSAWRAPEPAPHRVGRFSDSRPPVLEPVRACASGRGPLAGFRGLVLTQAWAGTYATELMALLGADVIQLETRGRLDSWRGTYQNPIPKNLRTRDTAKHPWNCSPLYNSVNLAKRCITVDLSEPDGVALFRELAGQADFVAENFSPRVMGNLGIDYECLCQIKPDIVMASLSAYGATGPWAHVPGIGGTIEPSSGMSALLGYEGEHPMNSGQMYPDPVAGLCGLAAILVALLHRDRTGEGQYIDLSMQEANFTFIGDAFLEYELNRTVRGPMGNSHPTFSPHGIYPARGDDEWIAIACETEDQWTAAARILDLEPDSEDFSGMAARKAREDVLDALIAARTRERDKRDLAAVLTEAGVPAAAVLAPDEIVADEALRERGHMQLIDHPEAGPAWQSTLPARFSASRIDTPAPAPLQGEHSFAVFDALLGMTPADYQDLCDREITGTGPSGKASIHSQA